MAQREVLETKDERSNLCSYRIICSERSMLGCKHRVASSKSWRDSSMSDGWVSVMLAVAALAAWSAR